MSGTQPTPTPAPNPLPPPEAEGFTPPGVRERAAAADDMIRQMRIDAGLDPAPAGTPTAPPDGGQPGAAPQTVPAAGSGEGAAVTPQPSPPTTPPTDDPPVSASALAALQDELRALRNDVKTWEGRTRAERKKAEEAQQRVADLEAQIASATGPAPSTDPLSSDQIETFGSDLMDAVAQHARSTMQPLLAALERKLMAEITTLRGNAESVQHVVAQTAQERFLAGLTREVPTWETINKDPAFLTWLGQREKLSRRVRQELLDETIQAHDAPACAEFFKEFLTQQGSPVPQAAAGTPPEASGSGTTVPSPTPTSAGSPTLADFAAPGTAHGGAPSPTGSAQPQVWKNSQIKAFYLGVGRGEYRTNPEEKDRIERSIAAAQREGRVEYDVR